MDELESQKTTSNPVPTPKHRMWLWVIVVVVIVFLVAAIVIAAQPVPAKTTPQNPVACILHGGQWSSGNGPFADLCRMKMSDGNKHCQSSNECRGFCMPVSKNNNATQPYLQEYGICSVFLPELETPDRFEGRPIDNGDY